MPRRRRKGRGKKSMNVSIEESEDDSSLQPEEKEMKSETSSEDLLKMDEAEKANASLSKEIEKTPHKDVRRSSRISQKIKLDQQDIEKVEPITTALEMSVVPENDKKHPLTVTENQSTLDNLSEITKQDGNTSICETKTGLVIGKELKEGRDSITSYSPCVTPENTEIVENPDVHEEDKSKVTKVESDNLALSKTDSDKCLKENGASINKEALETSKDKSSSQFDTESHFLVIDSVEDQMEVDKQKSHTSLQSLEMDSSTSDTSKCEDTKLHVDNVTNITLQQNPETHSSNVNLKNATVIISKHESINYDDSGLSLSNIDKTGMQVEASDAAKIKFDETGTMDVITILTPTVQDGKAELCGVNAPSMMEDLEKESTDNDKVVSPLQLDSKIKSPMKCCTNIITEDPDTELSVSNDQNSKQNSENILESTKVNLNKVISDTKQQVCDESSNQSECKGESVILSNINLTSSMDNLENTNTNNDSNDAAKGKTDKMVYSGEQTHNESKNDDIVTAKAASNLSEEPATTPAKQSESANQEGMKEKQNRIPGRSFIIGIKNPLKGKKTLFDCVLCFGTKRTPVPGPRIHSHIKSREHTLKVMEIENSSLYDLYKNDSITPTDRIITLLVGFETTQAKQALVLANPENYVEKRKAVQKKISLLRQLVSKKCNYSSTKTSDTKHEDIMEETDQKASNISGHISSALSSKRFDKVVILVNQIYESVLQHFAGPQVLIVADENLRFSNIANFIGEKSQTMPSKTLWLTLIGTYCIFQVDKRTGCILEECQTPLYTLTPSADILELTSALDTVNKIRMSCIALMNEIRSQLGPESTFFMLPPFPPTIYIESKFLHSTLHSLQTDSMEIYIASEEWIDHFNTVFTYFSKEMTSLFIEELGRMNYSQKTVFEYRANLSDKYIHVVRHLDESKTISLDSWKTAMFKLIFELLNGHDIIPEAGKQTGASISERIGSVEGTNVDHSCEATLSSTAAISTSSSERYDHLAFIGFPEQLNQLSTTGKSNISLWNLKFPLDWADMKTKFASLESISKKKKLFVILVDISLIAIEVFDSQCQVEQCKQKISYLTAGTSSFNALIEEKIDCINRLASKVKNHFGSNSKVILAPICSRYCIEKPVTVDQKSHANLHDALKHECRPCILEAPQSIWEDAVQKFEKMWKKEVYATLGASDIEILKLIEKYKRKPQSLLEWRKPDRSSLSSKSLYNSCKLFFTELIQTVLPASKAQQKLQIKQQRQEPSHIAQVPVMSKIKDSASSYTNTTNAYSQMSRILLPVQIKSHPPPPIAIQQQPGNFLPRPYNPDVYRMNTPYQMQQQPPSYSNNPYNQDVYGMNAPYQPQHQNYMGPNIPFSQPQIPFNNFQVPPPTTPYSSQVTYQSCAITYTQTPKNPAPIRQSVSQPERSLVKIPLNVSSDPEKTGCPQQVLLSSMETEAAEAFTESLKSFFPTVGSVDSNFDNAFIIGKKKIIQPMSEINLKNTTFINYNLSSVVEKDVPVLLSKIGTISKKSVCFLAFSLPVITKIVPLSPSCSKFGCKQPIPISNLKSSETSDSQSNPTIAIVKRIKELVTFVTNLAKFLPVIVLPLFPSRVFCDDVSVISKHRISHAIASCDCYVVLGTKEVWETHLSLFTQLWNNFLKANHRKYISSDLITKYTEVQRNSLTIKEHVNDFFTDYSEPTLWRAFLQTLMQVLMGYVESSPGSNLLSAIDPKTPVPKKMKENVKKLTSKNTSLSAELSSSLKTTLPQVKVWSLSSSIPDDFFFNLFKTVEPASLTEKHGDKFLIYMTRSSAILVVQKLNNCQLGDTTLKACITGAEDEPITLDTVQNNYINALFNQIYEKWRFVIVNHIKESLDREFEIINYKIQRCGRICPEVDKCLFYHNELDRRRSLNVHNYTQKMCPFPKVSVGACASGDACSFSHNIYEQMFFPTNFQTILCPTLKGQKCLKLPFCKFAHKGTPEMFYMGDWQDLVTFGTRSAFTFFAGAIKGISKLSSKKDVKVCLISPSQELLELAKSAVFSILKIHKLKAILLTKKWVNPESYNVFLGTPSTIAKFHGQLLSTKAAGALVVDGINHILDSSGDRESLLKICQKLKITTNRMSPINKVFVVSHYDSKITGIVSRFLGLSQLIEVEQTEESVRLPAPQFAACSGMQQHKEMKPDVKESVSFQIKQNEQKAFQAGVLREGKGKRLASKSPRGIIDRDRSRSTSRQKKYDSQRRKRSHSRSRRGRSRSPSRKRKGRSRSKSGRKSPSSFSRRKHSLSKSRSSKKKRYSQEKEGMTRTQPTSHHTASGGKTDSWEETKLKAESSVEPNRESLRQKLGEVLYAEFARAEEAAQKAHDEDFNSSYSTKMYGEYKEYYLQCEEEFYRKFGSNREGAHWEELWKGYWQSKLLDIKRMDWDKKREELKNEFERKAKSAKYPEKEKVDPPPSTSGFVAERFSVEGTLSLLQELSSHLGMLGPAVVAIVQSAKDLGTTTNKALAIFTDDENVVLIKMVLEKMRIFGNSAPEYLARITTRTIEWTNQLLEYAKNPSKEKDIGLNLNLEAIAKASVGKDSTFVLSLIKTALAYEGVPSLSKEEINDIFMKVCSMHFDMAMKG